MTSETFDLLWILPLELDILCCWRSLYLEFHLFLLLFYSPLYLNKLNVQCIFFRIYFLLMLVSVVVCVLVWVVRAEVTPVAVVVHEEFRELNWQNYPMYVYFQYLTYTWFLFQSWQALLQQNFLKMPLMLRLLELKYCPSGSGQC